ncbi:MAG TPA: DUF2752 domain-containing protein, partial [Acidobacteriota bacterium]|nr:DUF2752 domain-containing protein [Acidobacteriota bacterium]
FFILHSQFFILHSQFFILNSSLMSNPRSPWPTLKDWWEALRWVLLVFTVVVALTLAGSFVSYETVLSSGHPWLPRTHCSGCLFCGMTRSFCALSSGHWAEAVRWNRGGPVLYSAGWLWLAGSLVVFSRLVRTRSRTQVVTDS